MSGGGDMLFLGLDGGGTGCRAVLTDAAGRVMGRGEGGPANVMSDRDGALSSIGATIASALGGTDPGRVTACLALAGAEVSDAARWLPPLLPFARLRVVQDAEAATAGALGQRDGIVAALGTGSVFSRRRDGVVAIIGGRGAALGDEGGGAWLGRMLLARALRCHDGLHPHTPLTRSVLDQMGGVAGIIAFARDARGADLADQARALFAQDDDPAALVILKRADAEIADYITALQTDPPLPVVFTGGLGPIFAARLAARWAILSPAGSPLDGALELARAIG